MQRKRHGPRAPVRRDSISTGPPSQLPCSSSAAQLARGVTDRAGEILGRRQARHQAAPCQRSPAPSRATVGLAQFALAARIGLECHRAAETIESLGAQHFANQWRAQVALQRDVQSRRAALRPVQAVRRLSASSSRFPAASFSCAAPRANLNVPRPPVSRGVGFAGSRQIRECQLCRWSGASRPRRRRQACSASLAFDDAGLPDVREQARAADVAGASNVHASCSNARSTCVSMTFSGSARADA